MYGVSFNEHNDDAKIYVVVELIVELVVFEVDFKKTLPSTATMMLLRPFSYLEVQVPEGLNC